MTKVTKLSGYLEDEWPGGNRLENMSTRPTTVVTYTSSRKDRQLVPSLQVRLDPDRARLARRNPLRAIGMPRSVESAEPLEQARIIERICRAVIDDLRLPGVIPLGPGGKLPDEESCRVPLLVLAVMTRCSGKVWLRDRAAAIERLGSAKPVRLLLQPDLYPRVLERLAAPDWTMEVFMTAEGSETWR